MSDKHEVQPRDAFGLTPSNAANHAKNVEWWRGLTDEKWLSEGERTLLKSMQDWQVACECVQAMNDAREAEKRALAQVEAMAYALGKAKVAIP